MKKWQDLIAKHPIQRTIRQMIEVSDLPLPSEDPEIIYEHARFTKVAYLLQESLQKADPDITPIELLDRIQSSLGNDEFRKLLSNVEQARDPNTFRELNRAIDQSLSYILLLRESKIDRNLQEIDLKAATTAAENFISKLNLSRVNFERFLAKAGKELENNEKHLENINKQRSADIEYFQKELSTATKRYEETNKSFNDAFTTLLNNQKDEFSHLIRTLKNDNYQRAEDIFEEQKRHLDEKEREAGRNIDRIAQDSKKKHEAILEIYNLVALDSVTGGHKNIADREFTAASRWRKITIGSMITTIIWLAATLVFVTPDLSTEREFWLYVVKSASLTLILLTLSAYASRQAASHRENEQRARSFFLQIKAFDPFVSSLPEDDRRELKQDLARKIFDPNDHPQSNETFSSDDITNIERLIKVLPQLKSIIGK